LRWLRRATAVDLAAVARKNPTGAQNRRERRVGEGKLSLPRVRRRLRADVAQTKKFELMLTRRAKAYSSSGSVV